ncbi:MAG: hypothetical protein AABZ53_04840 [Planctomycetota bacterium]
MFALAIPSVCFFLSPLFPASQAGGGDGFKEWDRLKFWLMLNGLCCLAILCVGTAAVSARKCSSLVCLLFLTLNILTLIIIVAKFMG